ncbi:murein biosynthesis integral membrane protein MurJ [Rhodococcus rhodnii]|nr:murein biosynthesis integral membrane protein MurJ [Rhodococcus rhodnii]
MPYRGPEMRWDDAPTVQFAAVRLPQDPPPVPDSEVTPLDEQPSTGEAPDDDRNSNSRLLASTGSIAFATLVSRITGFAKQLLLVTTLGAAVASAYTVAAQIPNMISEFVLGAVLTAIVVPVLVRAEREDPDRGEAFVRRLFTASLCLLGGAALLATAAAPLLARLFVGSDGQVSTPLTTALIYMLLPAILFYGLSALFTAILNTRQIFKPGAWAPVLNNVVVLVVLAIFWAMPGEISLDPVRMGEPKLLVLGLGVTLGVVVQACSLLPAIRRAGVSLRPLWGFDDRLKQFGGMAVAIVLYVAISQIGFLVATRVSAHYDEAGPVIYNNAWLLLQLPYGVLGVTVLTAIMPRLSRNAAAEDTPAVVDDLSVSTRLTMIALIPIVTFLTIAGPQVGEALYGYGNFGSGDAQRLGLAVSFSAFTLIPYSLVLIHLRVFYAREQAWTPTWIVLGITSVKIVLSMLAPFVARDDQQVVLLLGAANGLGYIAGAVIGGWLLHRSLGNLQMANVGRTVWVVVVASLAGGAASLGFDRLVGLERLTGSLGALGSFTRVALGGILLLIVTFTILLLAKIPEVVSVQVALTRRLRGRRGGDEPDAIDDAAPAEVVAATPPERHHDSFSDAATILLPVVRDTPQPPHHRDVREPHHHGEPPRNVPYPGRDTTAPGQPVPHVRADVTPQAGTDRIDRFEREGVRVSDEDRGSRTGASGTGTADRGPATPSGQSPEAGRPERSDDTGATDTPTTAVPHERADTTSDSGAPTEATPAAPGGTDSAAAESDAPTPPAGAPAPRSTPRGPKLIPGASVAGGRYRLLTPHGGSRGLQYWQALDVKLDREVALTFVDADQRSSATGSEGPQAILSRTLRLGRINSPGLARVLDVVRGSSGGIVVAEWTPGRSLREMADTTPSPIGAARAISALAQAAETAHRAGGALSIDHPDRVRISINGDAVLAFPGTLADADATSDVRGLGAMLYALITARWPLDDPGTPPGGKPPATVGGLRRADRDASGALLSPRAVRPEVPFEISAVAQRALEANGGIRTAATVAHILDQATVVNDKTELIPALRIGQRAQATESLSDPEAVAQQKKKTNRMLLVLGLLGTVTVIVLVLLAVWLSNFLGGSNSDAPLDQQEFGLTSEATPPAQEQGGEPAPPPPPAATPVAPAGVTVYSPQGTPDSAATASNAIDGDPATLWSTDVYFQQFPALKNGVGLMVSLPDATRVGQVAITSPSPGTQVEIRSAPSPDAPLAQTQVIGTANLTDGVTDIAITDDAPTQNVLVWITRLSTEDGNNQTRIADVSVRAAG